jgi:hypothetical protein
MMKLANISLVAAGCGILSGHLGIWVAIGIGLIALAIIDKGD